MTVPSTSPHASLVGEALRGQVDRLQSRLPSIAMRLVEARRARARPDSRARVSDALRRPRLDEPLAAARLPRWRKGARIGGGDDPDRQWGGFMWFTPVIPNDGRAVERAAATATETLVAYGFDPSLEIVPLSHRAVEMLCAIVYDPDLAGGRRLSQRAAPAHVRDALSPEPPVDGGLPPAREDFTLLVRKLKTALDPRDILAPERYDFRCEGGRGGEEPYQHCAPPL